MSMTLSVSTVHKKKQTITFVDQLGPRSGAELKELAKALERHCRVKARVVQTGSERSIRLSGDVGAAAKAFLVRHCGPVEAAAEEMPEEQKSIGVEVRATLDQLLADVERVAHSEEKFEEKRRARERKKEVRAQALRNGARRSAARSR